MAIKVNNTTVIDDSRNLVNVGGLKTVNGTSILGSGDISTDSSTYVVKTANYTAVSGDKLLANTSGGSFTITLPASPSTGNTVTIADGSSFSINNLTVSRNGSTIEGLTEDVIMDIGGISVTFIYSGTTWQVYAQAGAYGGGVIGLLQVNGGISLLGTARRITGDFSNTTLSDRVMFQSTTANGQTSIGVLPNGTSTSTNLNLFSSADPANASIAQYVNTGAEVRLSATITGTGTYLPMTLYTGGEERVRVDTTGKVGIGTSSPSTTLDVNGTIRTNNSIYINNASPTIYLQDTDHNAGMIHVNNNIFYVLAGGVNGTTWSQINGYWPLEINLTNNNMSTGGSITAAGNVGAYSDISLKRDLKPIKDALYKVKQLTGYTYTRIDLGVRQTGLIAQDVQKVLPEAVTEGSDGILNLAYGNLVGLLVEAIKQQQEQIDRLAALL